MKKYKLILLSITAFYPLLAGINSIQKDFYAPNYRINIDATIEDRNFIESARVYFKSQKDDKYRVFSSMRCKKSLCRAVIPSPISSTNNIYYRIVYSNKLHKVFSSRELMITKKDMLILAQNQTKDKSEFTIYSEFAKIPKSVVGFSDNFNIKQVKKANRIGVIIDITDKKDAGIKDISKEIRSDYGGNASSNISPILIGALLMLLIAL